MTADSSDYDYQDRPCPRCSAEPGQPCVTANGNLSKWSHLVRRPDEDRWSLKYKGVRVRALCCECGMLRTVHARFHRRNDNDCSYDGPDGDRQGRGWRSTGTLKCAHCKMDTRHAYLRDELSAECRDKIEAEIMGWRNRVR